MKTFIVICFLFCSQAATAQGLLKSDTLALRTRICTFNHTTTYPIKVGQAIPQDYYTKCFGFFCKQELKMQQSHIPITFRIGSMDDCNRLEQKPGYR